MMPMNHKKCIFCLLFGPACSAPLKQNLERKNPIALILPNYIHYTTTDYTQLQTPCSLNLLWTYNGNYCISVLRPVLSKYCGTPRTVLVCSFFSVEEPHLAWISKS